MEDVLGADCDTAVAMPRRRTMLPMPAWCTPQRAADAFVAHHLPGTSNDTASRLPLPTTREPARRDTPRKPRTAAHWGAARDADTHRASAPPRAANGGERESLVLPRHKTADVVARIAEARIQELREDKHALQNECEDLKTEIQLGRLRELKLRATAVARRAADLDAQWLRMRADIADDRAAWLETRIADLQALHAKALHALRDAGASEQPATLRTDSHGTKAHSLRNALLSELAALGEEELAHAEQRTQRARADELRAVSAELDTLQADAAALHTHRDVLLDRARTLEGSLHAVGSEHGASSGMRRRAVTEPGHIAQHVLRIRCADALCDREVPRAGWRYRDKRDSNLVRRPRRA
ncbi:hypothetical protein MSPP1_003157 [Malassezia sp. CBS 17886]|nr:hypothetical protein MSPP1_003157 [Malassezia sp. CBS 17886]